MELLEHQDVDLPGIESLPPQVRQTCYVVKPGSILSKVLQIMQAEPAGKQWANRDLARLCMTRVDSLWRSMQTGIRAGLVRAIQSHPGATVYWELGDGIPTERIYERPKRIARADIPKQPREHCDAKLLQRLKDLYYSADEMRVGDPTILLGELMSAVNEVKQKRDSSRFVGAEIDAHIAMNLRAVAKAMMDARDSLLSVAREVL